MPSIAKDLDLTESKMIELIWIHLDSFGEELIETRRLVSGGSDSEEEH